MCVPPVIDRATPFLPTGSYKNGPMSNLEAARAVLKEKFGYSGFKPAQERVIEAVLSGDDVLAILPTGYGKSICFQIPAMMAEGCAVVISPLIALMKDQVDAANRHGIPASYINSHIEPEEAADRMSDFVSGALKLLYVAPERINSSAFRAALARATVSYLIVDEAHCASMWGHDFRPAYNRISEITDIIWEARNTRPTIVALTATATANIENDIVGALGMAEEYVRVIGDPIRANLTYDVVLPFSSEWTAVMRTAHAALSAHPKGKHLIYCGARKAAERIADMLKQDGIENVHFYHGAMDRRDRTKTQDDFLACEGGICCATNAFGMGIDIPNIRSVIHFGIPGSLEAYVQEAGRAGRDGLPSTVTLIRSTYSEGMQRRFVDNANPPIEVYQKVWAYLLRTTTDGQALARSAESIANAIDPNLSGDQVSTVLSVFDGHRLVHRQSYEGGSPARLLGDLSPFATKGTAMAKVVAYLQKLSDEAGGGDFAVDRTDGPFDAGVSSTAFASSLKKLVEADVLKLDRAFTGKTTTVLQRRADPLEVIPIEMLELRRTHDLARLQAMLDYQHAPADERKKAIRDYFGLNPS